MTLTITKKDNTMNNYIIGYDKNDIEHQKDLIQFKSVAHAMKDSDEFWCVDASTLEMAKKDYHIQREHGLTKIYM